MGVAQRQQGHLDQLVEEHVLAHQHELGVLLLAVKVHGVLVVLHHAEHGQHVAWRHTASSRGSVSPRRQTPSPQYSGWDYCFLALTCGLHGRNQEIAAEFWTEVNFRGSLEQRVARLWHHLQGSNTTNTLQLFLPQNTVLGFYFNFTIMYFSIMTQIIKVFL